MAKKLLVPFFINIVQLIYGVVCVLVNSLVCAYFISIFFFLNITLIFQVVLFNNFEPPEGKIRVIRSDENTGHSSCFKTMIVGIHKDS